MQHLIFVYGTLKQGYRNDHWNQGRRLPGEFHTVRSFPLYVIGPNHLPWLVHEPGQGGSVQGEVYEVDDAGLARMDALERIELPQWYRRLPLQVRDAHGQVLDCQAYFGDGERLRFETVHFGPVPSYTQAHAAHREQALAAQSAAPKAG